MRTQLRGSSTHNLVKNTQQWHNCDDHAEQTEHEEKSILEFPKPVAAEHLLELAEPSCVAHLFHSASFDLQNPSHHLVRYDVYEKTDDKQN